MSLLTTGVFNDKILLALTLSWVGVVVATRVSDGKLTIFSESEGLVDLSFIDLPADAAVSTGDAAESEMISTRRGRLPDSRVSAEMKSESLSRLRIMTGFKVASILPVPWSNSA